jgi:formylglycine-generating enzyme required for sulfatase activity
VKILDLGLARIGQGIDGAGELTSTGAIMGTIDYMAPEQATSTHDVDIRADIYSLGATLYRLLTGSPPFAGEKFDTPVKKLMALATQSPTAVRSLRPDVPAPLAAIIDKMLAKSPAARYATPEELAEALAPFCQYANLAALLARGSTPVQSPVAPAAEIGTQNQLSSPSGDTAPTIDRGASPLPLPLGEGRGESATGAKQEPRPLVAALGGRKIPRSLAIAAACGGLALAVLLGVIFFLQTPDGTVRIEINDPKIKIVIDDEGSATFTGVDKHKIVLKPGLHGITITRGDLTFGTTSFELKKGDKPRLKIEYIAGKVEVTKDGAALPLTPLRTVAQAGWHGWPGDAPPPAIAPFNAAEARKHQQEWAEYLGVPVEKEFDLGELADGTRVKLQMVLVPPGELVMGSTSEQRDKAISDARSADVAWSADYIRSEVPQHRTRITRPFYIGKYETTHAFWQVVMGKSPSNSEIAKHPVGGVSWADVQTFVGLLNKRPEFAEVHFALPTEAQWELACRAGTTTLWSHGDDSRAVAGYSWIKLNSNASTHAVGQLLPNAFGLHDMHGNVWELCADSYSTDDYRAAELNDPARAGGAPHVSRGGSYLDDANHCRSAMRTGAENPVNFIGFRLVAAIKSSRANGTGGVLPDVRTLDENALPVEAPAPAGFALRFDAESKEPDLSAVKLRADGPWTVEGWFTPRDPLPKGNNEAPLVFMVDPCGMSFYNSSQGMKWALRGPLFNNPRLHYIPSDAKVVAGQTVHIAITREPAGVVFFLNGEKQGEPLPIALSGPDKPLRLCLAGNPQRRDVSYQGDVEEVRVSSSIRYRDNFAPKRRFEPDAETIALFHFDDGKGDVLTDSSGNNHHGKIVGAKWVRANASPQIDTAVTVQKRPDGGYEATAANYRVQIAPTGLIQGVVAGQAKLIESTAFGGLGTVATRKTTVAQAGTTLTFTEGDDYRLIYEFRPQGFVVKCRVSTAAAERDGIDGKPYYLIHQTRFPKSAQRVRPHDGVAPFALPATKEEESYTNNFVVDFSDGSQIEVRCDQPSEHSGFLWTEGPYTWGRTNLKSDADHEIRFEIRPPGRAIGWQGWPADAPPPAIAPFDANQAKKHQEAWAAYLGVQVDYENSLGMKFRLIPPGEYLMGSPPAEIEEALKLTANEEYWQACIKSEAPQHKVVLTQPLYLGVHDRATLLSRRDGGREVIADADAPGSDR